MLCVLCGVCHALPCRAVPCRVPCMPCRAACRAVQCRAACRAGPCRAGRRARVHACSVHARACLQCACVSVHGYMHACIHAHMHTCIHAYMHTCTHTRTAHECVYTCVRVRSSTYACFTIRAATQDRSCNDKYVILIEVISFLIMSMTHQLL